MKRELDYFWIGRSYGGSQDWLTDRMMNLGGCAALTACDSIICLAVNRKLGGIYPYDVNNITREDYVSFSDVMKPYLHPRWTGIDKLSIFVEGLSHFLADRRETRLTMSAWNGDKNFAATREAVKTQIDAGLPVPCLVLKHKSPIMEEYVWHWFLLNGYEKNDEGKFLVKAVTYSEWEWLDLAVLWDTGYEKKGGLILYNLAI